MILMSDCVSTFLPDQGLTGKYIDSQTLKSYIKVGIEKDEDFEIERGGYLTCFIRVYMKTCVCVCVCMWSVCVCVCVRERERERVI